MKILLTCSALVCLLTMAFLSSATSASSEVVLVPTIRVARARPIGSWNDFKRDMELARVAQDVADYVETHPIQMLDPSALASYLGQHHDVTMSDGDYYLYVVGPDGEMQEICVPRPEIELTTGRLEDPIIVEIQWHVDFSSATSASSEIVVPTIRVVHARRIESWNDFKRDMELARVAQDVADYVETHPIQMLDPSALASYLGQDHDVTMSDGDYYLYVVGPDGEMQEICVPRPEIELATGQPEDPIIVEIQWHVDFS